MRVLTVDARGCGGLGSLYLGTVTVPGTYSSLRGTCIRMKPSVANAVTLALSLIITLAAFRGEAGRGGVGGGGADTGGGAARGAGLRNTFGNGFSRR